MHDRCHEASHRAEPAAGAIERSPGTARSGIALMEHLQRTAGNRAAASVARALSSALIQRKLTADALDEAKGHCLRNMATSEPFYANRFKKGLKGVLGKKYDAADDDDVRQIEEYLQAYRQLHAQWDFDTVVGLLGAGATKKDYVSVLMSLPWSGRKPAIVFGPTPTTGFFDTTYNVITLDPVKNKNADELLDTLTFECQNALQRTRLSSAQKVEDKKERGRAVAETEFVSDKNYVESLLRVNKASDYDQLVQKLAVPAEYLQPADYATSLKNRRVERPDSKTFPGQDKRQALWWWKTKGWGEQQKKDVWIAEQHSEEMESSEEAYSK
jgi:hypothetical protein